MTLTKEAQAALAETSTDALLTTFASLTHRIHAYGERSRDRTGSKGDRAHATDRLNDLRHQRDAVRDEILKRADG